MLFAALATNFILGSIPVEQPCAREKIDHCVELMQRVYRSTDPATGAAVRLIDGVHYDVTPIDVIEFADRSALVVRADNMNGEAAHAESGRFSIYYFSHDTQRRRPIASFLDFTGSGSFGYGGEATVTLLDGVTPALVTNGGGTWQGDSCMWVGISLIGQTRPQYLGGFLSLAETPELDVDATLVGGLSRYDFELRYTGTEGRRTINERVVYELVGGSLRRKRGRNFRAC